MIIKKKAMEYFILIMGINMKENLKIIEEREKGFYISIMIINI